MVPSASMATPLVASLVLVTWLLTLNFAHVLV
jgi:hypothetical protein